MPAKRPVVRSGESEDRHDQDLAERIGVSRQTINALEAGKYVPSTVLALKLARLFEKDVYQMFIKRIKTKWASRFNKTELI